jgi:hypothetical protein
MSLKSYSGREGEKNGGRREAVAAEALEESFFSQTCKRRAEDVLSDGVREREVGGGSGRYSHFTGFTGDVLMRHELQEPAALCSAGRERKVGGGRGRYAQFTGVTGAIVQMLTYSVCWLILLAICSVYWL